MGNRQRNRAPRRMGFFLPNTGSFNYRVTPQVMLAGLLFALVLGALGGVLPAFGAARKAILVALREG